MAEVLLDRIGKRYPNGFEAVHSVSLTIEDGEFIVLVGPSGCGKTTTLRMVAGLESITDGALRIDGQRVNDVAPKDRDIAMVFQSYALYPHMTVRDNLAFALKLRKTPKADIARRVAEVATMLELESMLDRLPKQLSGGQRQRVAMGRAIVRRPKVFLFDEPLSNLDAKLRVQMRLELSRLHQKLGVTSIYVTHDQVEAMTLADRMVIMKDGRVQQIDAPLSIYERPTNLFVATFIGSPGMNILPAVAGAGGLDVAGFAVPAGASHDPLPRLEAGRRVLLGVRPQHLEVHTRGSDGALLHATVDIVERMGSESYVYSTLRPPNGAAPGESRQIVARAEDVRDIRPGVEIGLGFDVARTHLFDPESEARL